MGYLTRSPSLASLLLLQCSLCACLAMYLSSCGPIVASLFPVPQRALGVEKVEEYLRTHPSAGPWLDRLGRITACGMLLGIWHIVCDLAVDVALSLLVLQVFRKGRLRWLGLATVANAVYATTLLLLSPLLSQFSWTATFLARAAFYGSFGMGSLWLIGDMRDRDELCGGSSTP